MVLQLELCFWWQIGRQGSTSQVVSQQKMQAHAQNTADTACQRAAAESSRTCTCAGRRGERPSVVRCPNTKSLGVSHLEGGLNVLIHHLNVGLVDGHGAPSQTAGLVDGHAVQQGVRCPALLQDQQQFLQAQCS